MNIYRRLQSILNRTAAVISFTAVGLMAGSLPALAADPPSGTSWTTADCTGSAPLKTGFQQITSLAWSWGEIAGVAVAVLLLIAIPFLALSRKRGLDIAIKFIVLEILVLMLAGALISFIVGKASCAS